MLIATKSNLQVPTHLGWGQCQRRVRWWNRSHRDQNEEGGERIHGWRAPATTDSDRGPGQAPGRYDIPSHYIVSILYSFYLVDDFFFKGSNDKKLVPICQTLETKFVSEKVSRSTSWINYPCRILGLTFSGISTSGVDKTLRFSSISESFSKYMYCYEINKKR